MSIRGKAFIVGAYEHPGRQATGQDHSHRSTPRSPSARCKDAGLSLNDVDGFFSDAMGLGMGVVSHGRVPRAEAVVHGLDRDRRLVVPVPRRPRGRGDRRGQVPGRAGVAGGQRPRRARPLSPRRPSSASRRRSARSPSPGTPWPRGATCTSSARPARSWRRSRWRPRITRSTTRTPCCKKVSPSRRCWTRRWWPIRCTASTAA